MSLSEKIKRERQRLGLTQEQLANLCSVARGTVSNWETGRRNPDFDMLFSLAKIFEMTIDELIDDSYFQNNKIGYDVVKNKLKPLYVVPVINIVLLLFLIFALMLFVLPRSKIPKQQKEYYVINNVTSVDVLNVNNKKSSSCSFEKHDKNGNEIIYTIKGAHFEEDDFIYDENKDSKYLLFTIILNSVNENISLEDFNHIVFSSRCSDIVMFNGKCTISIYVCCVFDIEIRFNIDDINLIIIKISQDDNNQD